MNKDNKSFDTALIRDLAVLLDETNLTEIELEQGETRIRVAREISFTAPVSVAAPAAAPAPVAPVAAAAPAATAAPAPAADASSHPGTITSPMVGTAYLAAEPGAAPFIQVGDKVAEGQSILIIEAMKTMNHIPATKAGTVKQILVEDAQPVEFGEPLIIVE
ncbi:acetyl-CoA carboxylase biotin carboxyl carrier protein [Labrenzia sp. PHM005]|uniref:acetyl-CoA carboxylase biotin carboxyl carrier protein n=1 Tax=Labrenzia sp. PHM005 TaxID=2590016 RepID=UPI00113FDE50|nr:acetyl-CoA carboxylase biotin carboxyl carrier protein [Labrenzia sp. PHM005]QDG77219.1 acetyl-CoA carboxylase biotin carboxyl carrier protein [Labrenzia sp. PHM005]